MKTKEELNELKKEVDTLRGKFAEFSEEELAEVAGGVQVLLSVLKSPENMMFSGLFD